MSKHIAPLVILILALNPLSSAQSISDADVLSGVTLKALSYFKQIKDHQYDAFLRSIQPSTLAPELRARVLSMLPKHDLVNASPEDIGKLKTLDILLKYHRRDSVIEIKLLRAPTATAAFLAGTAVLITEPALKLLNIEELQAVVAHELGHEHYWNRFEQAREKKNYAEVQELELRCDGIAVITLQHVGINPANLISAITRLNKHNQRPGSPSSPNYVDLNERVAFIQRMIQLVSRRQS